MRAGGDAMLVPEEIAAMGPPFDILRDYQLRTDEAVWKGRTIGVDTVTREVFLGGCATEIPHRPTVVIVQTSKVDAERKRLRLGGRWRRVR
jgi:hypothetical protein